MMRQFELVERIKAYDPNADEDAVNRAGLDPLEIEGGQTAELNLGALVINLAEGLAGATWSVRIFKSQAEEPFVRNDAKGNDYYLFRPKPLPAGVYDLA